MNKGILQEIRSKYHTEAAILKRIEFCEARRGKYSHTYPYDDQLPCLYAVLGEIRTSNIHKMHAKTAYNNKKNKINRITHLTQRNRKYEENLKNFICDTASIDVCPAPNEVLYKFYRFFFPYKRSTPTSKLRPIGGFTTDVALVFIDTLIKAHLTYEKLNINIYDIFCCHRMTGKEFIRMYNNGVDSYKKLFPNVPAELLHKLYNVRQAGNKAVGNGEYLMKLVLNDVIDSDKNGDVCTASGVNLEMKSDGGRLSCQKQSDVEACDEILRKNTFLYDCSVLDHGMIRLYNIIKLNWAWNEKLKAGWTDQDIIRYFARCKIKTYDKYLSQADKDLFVKNMTDNWDAFFFDGQFNEKSVDWINVCHDAFVYPRLEGFSHLKIDSRQPTRLEKRKEFDVHFKIFYRNDFTTPGLIIRLLESGAIIPSGTIKNNGRDNAVKVSIK